MPDCLPRASHRPRYDEQDSENASFRADPGNWTQERRQNSSKKSPAGRAREGLDRKERIREFADTGEPDRSGLVRSAKEVNVNDGRSDHGHSGLCRLGCYLIRCASVCYALGPGREVFEFEFDRGA